VISEAPKYIKTNFFRDFSPDPARELTALPQTP